VTATTSANFPLLVSREQAGSAIAGALRLFVGRGRRYSVKQLANATGVKDRVIECAIAEGVDWRPLTPEALLSLSLFLGEAFTNEWLHLAKQGAFDLPEGDDGSPLRMVAENAADNAVVTERLIDNDESADDRRILRPVGLRMMARGARLARVAA
jgi:hypothetical protein